MRSSILILTSEFPPQPGGIGVHAHQLATGFSKEGMQVTVITDQRSATGAEEHDFDKDQSFTIIRIRRHRFLLWSYLQRIWHAFHQAKKAEVVFASGKFSLWQAGWISRFQKAKYIGILHGTELNLPHPRHRKWTENALKRMDVLIAVSRYTKSLVAHLNLPEVVVIPNGFEITPPEFTEKTKASKTIKLITVGNLTQRKGQHHVIQALPLLLKTFPDLEYHLVGIPTEKEKLEQLAAGLGVVHTLIFHGRVEEKKKSELLQSCTVFVMLSEKTAEGDVEGFGIAILEANALGLPAIGATDCGIEDAVKDHFSGRLIKNDVPEQLETALKEILADYSRYSEQAKTWSSDFTVEKMIERYLGVLISDS